MVKTLYVIQEEVARSKDVFIREHKKKYKDDKRFPPAWKNGKVIGTTNQEHNARWIGERTNQVSQFRTGGGTMSVYYDGPYELTYPYGTWEAVVQCGDAPYSYDWRVSYDGFNYGGVLGTGETFGHHTFENFYLRLTVTSDDGQLRSFTRYIPVLYSPYRIAASQTGDINLLSDELNSLDLSLGEAYPNPTTNRIYIPFTVNQRQAIKIELFDFNGKHLKTLVDADYEKGIHEFSLNTTKFKSGLYMYQLTGKDFTSTKKIIINK